MNRKIALLKGFTMIELLIVIGVLGILSVGVLAAVDPFEQLKKARDTNTRQSVISLHTAMTRYFATHNALPWDTATPPTGCSITGDGIFASNDRTLGGPVSGLENCIKNSLEADGELKPDFVKSLGSAVAAAMTVSSKSSGQLTICFAPTSKSVFAEETTKYSPLGVDQTTASPVYCTPGKKADSTSIIGTCYFCAK